VPYRPPPKTQHSIGLVLLFALATALCGGCGSISNTTGGNATVSGRVIYRGCVGAAVSNARCDLPKDGVTVVFTSSHQSDFRVTTVSGGKYSVDLPSGNYQVHLEVNLPLLEGPATIAVQPGKDLNIDFVVAAPYE